MSKKNTHTNVKVDSKNFDSFEKMVRRFIKKVKKERIVEQVKERRYYEKPSVVKRRAKLLGIKRQKKREREFQQKINSAERLNTKVFLIDIDGTICDDIKNEDSHLYPTANHFPSALQIINKWYDEGHVITFFTAREGKDREVTETWLKEHGFRYHGLVMDKPRIKDKVGNNNKNNSFFIISKLQYLNNQVILYNSLQLY